MGDAEIRAVEDILLEKGVHLSDLSIQIKELKKDFQEKENLLDETIFTHKQEKHALIDNIDQANIAQEQLEIRLEEIIDESARTRKNLQAVTKEASKTKAKFEDKINELKTEIE